MLNSRAPQDFQPANANPPAFLRAALKGAGLPPCTTPIGHCPSRCLQTSGAGAFLCLRCTSHRPCSPEYRAAIQPIPAFPQSPCTGQAPRQPMHGMLRMALVYIFSFLTFNNENPFREKPDAFSMKNIRINLTKVLSYNPYFSIFVLEWRTVLKK